MKNAIYDTVVNMFGKLKKFKINTDENLIDKILSRSVAEILPSRDVLKKKLMEGVRLRFYIGADATGPELHLGHATNFILLEKIRQLGHEVIILFGDFTAMIGDPTDKGAVRQKLSQDQVKENIQSWKKQVEKVISFSDKTNPAIIKQNSTWLSQLKFNDIVTIASHFTVQHMIERDMFDRRLKENKPVYLHEFLYPLMQGYDSVVMDVDVEVGGTDQTFNMLAGRTLQKRFNNKEKFVITTNLLEDPNTGKKLMSKSEGGYIALNDSPSEMYGKTMALPDEVIVSMFTDTTYVSNIDIQQIKKDLENGNNPRDIKMRLAREIVTIYHGEDEAEKAENGFVETFRNKGVPEDTVAITVTKGVTLKEVGKKVVVENIVSSNTDFNRLLRDEAISNADTGEKITDSDYIFETDTTLKIGKKRFVNITLS